MIITILLAVIVIVVLIALIGMIYTRQRSEKSERENMLELDVLRQQNQQLVRELQLAVASLNESSANALNLNTESIQKSNILQMESLLSPLQQRLSEFRNAVNDAYISDNASRQSLSQQIQQLITLNASLGKEAHELSQALRGNTKIQGDWGEFILTSLLDSAGLTEGIHFDVQPSTDCDGKTLRGDSYNILRPDVILNLPDGHKLILDSKTSLTAYTELCAAETKEDIEEATKRHVKSVKKHIDELGDKKYQNAVKNSAMQVIMFIPNDGAYIAAVSADPELYDYALKNKVAIVSPAHLYSIVLLIKQLWNKENQNRNSEQIAKTGGLLYDSIVKFVDELDKVERLMNQTLTSLTAARITLTQGSKSITARASRLRDLGASTTRSLDS